MTIQLVSWMNQSTRLSDGDAEKIVTALARQLATDVAPLLGQVPALEWVPTGKMGSVGKPGVAPAYFIDTPDIPDADGYHDVDPTTRTPFAKVFISPTLDSGGTPFTGPNSVSVTASHELLELLWNPGANLWAQGPTGVYFARERCDAVQGDSYPVLGCAMSNFVLDDFFFAGAPNGSRLDFLGKLTTPFTGDSGGYQLVLTDPGTVSQVFSRFVPTDHEIRHVRPDVGLYAVFGPKFPEEKKAAKILKAQKRYAAASLRAIP